MDRKVAGHLGRRWWNPSLEDRSNDSAHTMGHVRVQQKTSPIQRDMSPLQVSVIATFVPIFA
jgi:hypothetical protein